MSSDEALGAGGGPPGRVLPLLLSELRGGGPTGNSAAWHRALAFSVMPRPWPGSPSPSPAGSSHRPAGRRPGWAEPEEGTLPRPETLSLRPHLPRGGSWPPVPQLPGPVREPASPQASPAAGLRSLGPAAVLVGTFPWAGTLSRLALHASGTRRFPCAARTSGGRGGRVRLVRLKMVSQDRCLEFSLPPALLGCVLVGRASSLGEPRPRGRNEGQRGRGRPGAPRLAVG